MSHRLVSALLTAALLCPGWAALAHAAPEGPAPVREELPEEDTPGELDTHQTSETPEATTSQLSETPRRGSAAAPAGVDPRHHQHARKMYLIGEQCRRNGDYDMARNCYEETRLLCPASDYARKAAGRLRRLEALRDAVKNEPVGEEQEPAKAAEPDKVEDYSIQLSVPGVNRIGRLESPEALKERMKQEAAKFGEQLAFPEEETPSACPCMPSGLFHETTEDLYKLTAAHTLYRIGERCRRNGDPEMARNCYEEAHLICPESRYGRLAIRRLAAMPSRRSKPSTESGVPQSRSKVRPTPSGESIEPAVALLPTLPPVDPNVVPAFNHLLTETAEPPLPELIRIRQEVRAGEKDCEEQSGVTPCGGLFPQTEPPSLTVEVPCHDLVIASADEQPTAAAPPPVSLPRYRINPPDILQIQCREGLLSQPVSGPHLVRPDGTIGVGAYGSVYIAGMTVDEAKGEIAKLIHSHLDPAPKSIKEVLGGLSVDVLAYNSQVYYVITDRIGLGETVQRFPITGKECVLDAIANLQGLPPEVSKHRIWVARPMPGGGDKKKIMSVDWIGISQKGQMATNYQMLPGDRLYLKAEKAVVKADPSDLSDWLRDTVRVLNGAGSVRVEVTRLGRLMAQGEEAVRTLGCEIVHEGGRSFVVYPCPPRRGGF